jgi:hypothetical protein
MLGVVGATAAGLAVAGGAAFGQEKKPPDHKDHDEHDEMAQKCANTCSDCAKVCDDCIAECEKINDPEMKAVVDACRKTAKECRKMVKMMAGK